MIFMIFCGGNSKLSMLHIIFMIFYGDILSYFLYRKSFLTMRIKVVPFLGMFVGSCYGGKGFFQRNL